MPLATAHDPALVTLSILVACFAAYTALDLAGRIRASRRGWSRAGWLGVAAVAMGGGIWSMHFIAMLAFTLPVPVSFDRGLTVLSLGVAMTVTAVGFYVIGTRPATNLRLALAGAFMGLGIVAMHYTGMAAMRMPAHLHYNPLFVALSAVVAIGAATAALGLTLRTSAIGQRILAAVVMGFAIAGMHYTGMLAAHFSAHAAAHTGTEPAQFGETGLALSVAGITIVILLCALVASLIDRRFTALVEALRLSQRMEAIGQLTGGVAHDFNNLLMVISGATHRLSATAIDPAALRAIEMIETAVKRGQALTSQLLTVAGRRTAEPTVVDLGALLPTFGEMLRRSLRGNIEIRTVAADRPCRVRIDMTELELALLNLGVNARDAMPDGGVLTLSVKAVTLAGEPEAEGLRGDYVLLEISDTGVGISPELITRVFEPFFTTKDPGKGTGLGLSQVYGFARQSGGTATARSIAGEGTTIALYLPVTRLLVEPPRAAPQTQDSDGAGEPTGEHSGRVLLIEDDDDVAAISASYLEELGYQIERAANGADALRRLEANHVSYCLVFSDILMPGGTSGLELARIVRERYPDLPVLLTTGYSASAQDAVQAGFSVILKPFDLEDLSAAVRGVMPRRGTGC
jgi:NO-binding membrane sensor protein with MHYT domain/CheY-like chemotaxis protein